MSFLTISLLAAGPIRFALVSEPDPRTRKEGLVNLHT